MNELTFYYLLLKVMVISAIVVAIILVFITAPYGRHVKDGWGPVLKNSTGWIIMETPALVGFIFFYLMGEFKLQEVPLVMFCYWVFHYFYRSFLYPFKLGDNSKKVPAGIILTAWAFNITNAYLNARYLTHVHGKWDVQWLTSPWFIIGSLLFFTGFYIHYSSDSYVLSLKKASGGKYVIPEKGLFKYVSNPNYLGETIEWVGWALATWSPAGVVFAFWTIANLWPRALSNHRWYLENFQDYPENRKAIIPFLL